MKKIYAKDIYKAIKDGKCVCLYWTNGLTCASRHEVSIEDENTLEHFAVSRKTIKAVAEKYPKKYICGDKWGSWFQIKNK